MKKHTHRCVKEEAGGGFVRCFLNHYSLFWVLKLCEYVAAFGFANKYDPLRKNVYIFGQVTENGLYIIINYTWQNHVEKKEKILYS